MLELGLAEYVGKYLTSQLKHVLLLAQSIGFYIIIHLYNLYIIYNLYYLYIYIYILIYIIYIYIILQIIQFIQLSMCLICSCYVPLIL